MTVPRERKDALYNALTFLRALIDPKKTPRVPRAIRKEAYYVLKHFPTTRHIEELTKLSPKILGDLHE